jgi:hypothetical protein
MWKAKEGEAHKRRRAWATYQEWLVCFPQVIKRRPSQGHTLVCDVGVDYSIYFTSISFVSLCDMLFCVGGKGRWNASVLHKYMQGCILNIQWTQ